MSSTKIRITPLSRVTVVVREVDDIAQITFGDPQGAFTYARPTVGTPYNLMPHFKRGENLVHLQVVNQGRFAWKGVFDLLLDGSPIDGSPFQGAGDDFVLQRVHEIGLVNFILKDAP